MSNHGTNIQCSYRADWNRRNTLQTSIQEIQICEVTYCHDNFHRFLTQTNVVMDHTDVAVTLQPFLQDM